MIAKGANVNWVNKQGLGALDSAIRGCTSAQCVKALLDLGADPNAAMTDGWTGLMTAATSLSRSEDDLDQRFAIVRHLVSAGANINAVDHIGQTALMFAVDEDDIEMCQQLLEIGADQDLKNIHGRTAIHYAKPQFLQSLTELFADYAA